MTLAANALATVASLYAETGVDDVDLLARLINSASDRIAAYLNRTLYYDPAIVESVAGYGGTDLLLSRPPIESIASITWDGVTVDADDYSIGEAGAGIVFKSTGWSWDAARAASITRPQLPGTEQKLYEVTYAGGWVTEPQVDADQQLGTPLGWARTLPYDIEDACIRVAAGRIKRVGSDPNVSSEKLMSYAVSYKVAPASGLPEEIKAVLDAYRLGGHV